MDYVGREQVLIEARMEAERASDAEVIRLLRGYADDIEDRGRAHASQWIREAANRLQMHINKHPR